MLPPIERELEFPKAEHLALSTSGRENDLLPRRRRRHEPRLYPRCRVRSEPDWPRPFAQPRRLRIEHKQRGLEPAHEPPSVTSHFDHCLGLGPIIVPVPRHLEETAARPDLQGLRRQPFQHDLVRAIAADPQWLLTVEDVARNHREGARARIMKFGKCLFPLLQQSFHVERQGACQRDAQEEEHVAPKRGSCFSYSRAPTICAHGGCDRYERRSTVSARRYSCWLQIPSRMRG